MEIAQSFRDEYERQFLDLKDEERELIDRKRQLQLLQRQLDEAQDASKSGWLDHANKAISCIRKKDLISLKSAYKQLFQKIIVHPLDSTRLQLEFIFKSASTSIRMGVDKFCPSVDLVEHIGIEPMTSAMPLPRSTN